METLIDMFFVKFHYFITFIGNIWKKNITVEYIFHVFWIINLIQELSCMLTPDKQLSPKLKQVTGSSRTLLLPFPVQSLWGWLWSALCAAFQLCCWGLCWYRNTKRKTLCALILTIEICVSVWDSSIIFVLLINNYTTAHFMSCYRVTLK